MTTNNLATRDAELIAAFIDRRLSDDERQAFMERLDSDEALYEVFVETVRYHDQTSGKADNVLEYPAWRKKWMLPAAIAAVLAVAVATPVLIRSLSEESYAEALVADGRLDPYLGEGWYEQPWSVMRGSQPGTSEADTAFRIGVRVVDLEIALRTGKTDDARVLTYRLESLLRVIDFSEPLQESYLQLREGIELDTGAGQLLRLAETNERLLSDYLPDLETPYESGLWAETGKLAARSGNRDLLGSRSFRWTLQQLSTVGRSEEVGEKLESIAVILTVAAQDLDLKQLEERFEALIQAR